MTTSFPLPFSVKIFYAVRWSSHTINQGLPGFKWATLEQIKLGGAGLAGATAGETARETHYNSTVPPYQYGHNGNRRAKIYREQA